MTSAPITPGTHPHRVSRNTMSTDPHPRSITASGGKKMARRTRRRDIGLLFKGFQCPTELIRAGGRLTSAADAIQFLDDVVDFLASDQTADRLQIAVASAHEEDLLDHAVVIDRHIDELRAGALGFVEGVGHNFSNEKNNDEENALVFLLQNE